MQQRTKLGGPLNDELLGRHGSDILLGRCRSRHPLGRLGSEQQQHASQRDILSGGPGNDWLYPSHGRSVVRGGPGTDYVWAYYGKGTIDCGAGIDTARVRTNGAFKLRNCERIRHFCSNGENDAGLCLSPTGKAVAAAAEYDPRARGHL